MTKYGHCIASARSSECSGPTDQRVVQNAFIEFENNAAARVAYFGVRVDICSGADLGNGVLIDEKSCC